jgi:alpha-tubulin suppressor-like RCC1 family protein
VSLKGIAAGGSQSLALDTQGRVWQWGTLNGTRHLLPVRVTTWPNRTPTIVSIAAGAAFNLAVSDAGRVYGRPP